MQLMRLLVGSLVGLLVGKSYHTKQKDGYSLPTKGCLSLFHHSIGICPFHVKKDVFVGKCQQNHVFST